MRACAGLTAPRQIFMKRWRRSNRSSMPPSCRAGDPRHSGNVQEGRWEQNFALYQRIHQGVYRLRAMSYGSIVHRSRPSRLMKPPRVKGDRVQVQHVLSNLITNAIDIDGGQGWVAGASREVRGPRRRGRHCIGGGHRNEESARKSSSGYSIPCSLQNQAVWEWVCRSAVRSLRPMTAVCGLPRTNPRAPSFSSCSPPTAQRLLVLQDESNSTSSAPQSAPLNMTHRRHSARSAPFEAPSTSNASSFERHRLAMLFTPLPPRALARGGEGSGVGGSAAITHVAVPADRPPTPDPSTRRFAGGGEKKSVLAHVRWKAL